MNASQRPVKRTVPDIAGPTVIVTRKKSAVPISAKHVLAVIAARLTTHGVVAHAGDIPLPNLTLLRGWGRHSWAYLRTGDIPGHPWLSENVLARTARNRRDLAA